MGLRPCTLALKKFTIYTYLQVNYNEQSARRGIKYYDEY